MVRRIFPILQSQSVQGCKNITQANSSGQNGKKSLVRHEFSDICGCIVRALHEPVIEVSTFDVSHATIFMSFIIFTIFSVFRCHCTSWGHGFFGALCWFVYLFVGRKIVIGLEVAFAHAFEQNYADTNTRNHKFLCYFGFFLHVFFGHSNIYDTRHILPQLENKTADD